MIVAVVTAAAGIAEVQAFQLDLERLMVAADRLASIVEALAAVVVVCHTGSEVVVLGPEKAAVEQQVAAADYHSQNKVADLEADRQV